MAEPLAEVQTTAKAATDLKAAQASDAQLGAAGSVAPQPMVVPVVVNLPPVFVASTAAVPLSVPPAPPTGTPTVTYTFVAVENASFTVDGSKTVRFGVASGSRWVVKTVSGKGDCTNTFFGQDPAVGVVKGCEVASSSVVANSGLPVPKPIVTLPPAPVATSVPKSGNMPSIDVAKIPARSLGLGELRVSNTSELTPASDGEFRTVCTFSHMSFDDPIVFPGQSGRSHLHTFFGNVGVDANSTPESLRTTGNSTCLGGIANRSAYWVPTLIDTKDGTPLKPDHISTYYKSGNVDGSTTRPIPIGLRMIAGEPTRTTPGYGSITEFKCIGGPNDENDKYGQAIGNCDVGAQLYQEVFFPQCWDGVNLDSPDHKSHMAYPMRIVDPGPLSCPSTHPVALPKISFNVVYNVTEKNAPLRWRLASDNYDQGQPGGYSNHGDWFNGWKGDISDAWAKSCVEAKRDCHSHLLGDGRMLY